MNKYIIYNINQNVLENIFLKMYVNQIYILFIIMTLMNKSINSIPHNLRIIKCF